MRRESHVRFCEGGGVRFPSATRLVNSCKLSEANSLVGLNSPRKSPCCDSVST